ncbi:late competence protein ComER [Bacillus aquiflavi]|uniref:late competence protein ComER n=1 Tax=Bacillus aquiflavi TaxID=2672567 RepID=UPI001CA99398|nr:late competence protein ComER [Bacillus aquiflavi]UAC47316.1 late competence protein ComER [Bacillus aquiflavi]
MKLGIIGTGNMGRILTEAMIDGKVVSPSSVTIMNRTKSKAIMLKHKYKEINVVDHAEEAVQNSRLIFLCVKPHDMFAVLHKIKPSLTKNHCLISITSPVSVEQLKTVVSCSVARAIPSITNRALAGVALITFGENCSIFWKEVIWNIFSEISKPVEINNDITRVASDIVSCGPAFYSYITQRLINAAVKETKIDINTATKLASEMLIGLGELLRKGYYTLPTLQEKVCVKGGITGEGIKVLEEELEDVFEQLFRATHLKYEEDLDETTKHFSVKNST